MRPALVACVTLLLVTAAPALAQFTVTAVPAEPEIPGVAVRLLFDDAALHVEMSIPTVQLRFNARPLQLWKVNVNRWVASLIEAVHSYLVSALGRSWNEPCAPEQPS